VAEDAAAAAANSPVAPEAAAAAAAAASGQLGVGMPGGSQVQAQHQRHLAEIHKLSLEVGTV